MGPLRELIQDSIQLVISQVVSIQGRFGDPKLMPELPGLSDAGNCRDWNTGVPIDLESIRDKDEDYWDLHGGTPKAFISRGLAEELWQNRFGTHTAFRFDLKGASEGELTEAILNGIRPEELGFTLENTRSKGMEAAGSGVDFSQLFGGLSFFLLAAGILLTVLLFLLNLESRKDQLRTLVVMGIPVGRIRRIMFSEGILVSLVGAIAGLFLAVVYNRLVFMAMNGVWRDVVRTEMMQIDIRTGTLILGFLITLLIGALSILFPLNRLLRKQFLAHRRSATLPRERGNTGQKGLLTSFIISLLIALVLIFMQLLSGDGIEAGWFFAAGGLLLVAFISLFTWYLKRVSGSSLALDLSRLSWKNATMNLTRSLSIVILFSIGAFLVISTGSNRKDLFINSEEKSSGTGGFLYFGESTLPVLQNLNSREVRFDYGLDGAYSFIQFRRADGDDASCLNLNKIISPRILGVDPGTLWGRFTFETTTDLLDELDPWSSLDQELPDGLIPAIADETVIKWGLGLSVGDTLHYLNSQGKRMELLLIGGLAPSVFQGNVIISEKQFLKQYPESSGTNVFLVSGQLTDTAMISTEVGRGLRDLGWDMQLSASRLAEFNSVTNTYLSIFMVMGALGLLVGIFGLVVVLSRSILERRREIALLKSVGYSRNKIGRLIVVEYLFLLWAGILAGFGSAIVATLPAILSSHTGTSFTSILLWLGILVLNGWIWILLITRISLRNRTLYNSLRND